MGKLFVTEDWEPGRSQGLDLKVSNNGSLALKWQLYFTDLTVTGGTNDVNLADVLDVYVGAADAQSVEEMTMVGTLSQVNANGGYVAGDELTAKDGKEFKEFSVVLKMQEDAGNDYQKATVTFSVELRATQTASETDGFGNSNYDAAATGNPDEDWAPGGSTTVTVVEDQDTVLNVPGATVTVPGEAKLEEGVSALTLSVANTEKPEGVDPDTKSYTAFEIEVEGLAQDNSAAIPVALCIGTGLENVEVYYNDELLTVEDNQVSYDPATGYVSFTTRSFGPFTVVYDVVNDGNFSGGNGTPEHPYLISTLDDLLKIGYKGTGTVDGEDYFYNHVFQLTNDIDMQNTPIRNLGSFRGLLDGNGHKLLNVNFTSASEDGYGSTVGLFAALNGGSNSEIYEATTSEEKASDYCYHINGKDYIITSGAVVDLTIESGTIYSDANGAVSPLGAGQNTAYIINVTNNVDIVAEGQAYFIAGIVSGTRGTGLVINCTNNGDITYTGTPTSSLVVGGITAQLYGGSGGSYPDILRPYSAAVYGCVNNGNINASGRDVGGIVGQTHGYDAALKKAIVNCTNTGDIAGLENVGGIIGRNSSTGTTLYLLNNTNTGKVSLLENGVAGTSGDVYGKNDGVILDSAN